MTLEPKILLAVNEEQKAALLAAFAAAKADDEYADAVDNDADLKERERLCEDADAAALAAAHDIVAAFFAK